MQFKRMVVTLVLLLSFCFSLVALPGQAAETKQATTKHSAAWYRKHRRHSAAWYKKHSKKKHSAAWYRQHQRHNAAWYKKHSKKK